MFEWGCTVFILQLFDKCVLCTHMEWNMEFPQIYAILQPSCDLPVVSDGVPCKNHRLTLSHLQLSHRWDSDLVSDESIPIERTFIELCKLLDIQSLNLPQQRYRFRWIATRLVSLPPHTLSLCKFLKFCSVSWYDFKIIPNMKLPCIIRHSVICNCANCNISDISDVMP